jgi:hypothetical protein
MAFERAAAGRVISILKALWPFQIYRAGFRRDSPLKINKMMFNTMLFIRI